MKTYTKFRGRVSMALILGGAMALAAHSARGTVAQDAAQVTVRYDDLNLSSEYGLEILKRRIRYAAETVCGDADSREINRSVQHHKCSRTAAVGQSEVEPTPVQSSRISSPPRAPR